MSEASKPDEHDQAYWNAYYAARPADIAKPSSFAVWAWKFLNARPEAERGTTLVDLGCGNGRDTEFFGDKFSVTGIDNSAAAVESNSKNTTRVQYKLGSVATFRELVPKVDIVYSRFVLHALPSVIQTGMLAQSAEAIAPGGFLIIETRSVNDPLCGDGTPVKGEENAWESATNRDTVSKHYRRFQSLESLTKEVEVLGFEVVEAYEDAVNSWHKSDHAVVVRLIARRT